LSRTTPRRTRWAYVASCLPSKTSMMSLPGSAPTVPNWLASWCSTRTAIGSVISVALRASSSRSPRRSAEQKRDSPLRKVHIAMLKVVAIMSLSLDGRRRRNSTRRLPHDVRHQRHSDVASGIEVSDGGACHRAASEGHDLCRLLAHDIAIERLASLIASQNLVQQIRVVLAAPIELALQVAADTRHLIFGQRRVSHGGHFLEHARHEALDLGRIAGPLDGDPILRPRISAGL